MSIPLTQAVLSYTLHRYIGVTIVLSQKVDTMENTYYYPEVAEFFRDLKQRLAKSGSRTTLRHLATAWGVSTAATQSWMHGVRAPQVGNIMQIATAIHPNDMVAQKEFTEKLFLATKVRKEGRRNDRLPLANRLMLRFYDTVLSQFLVENGFESADHKELLATISDSLSDHQQM